MMCRDGNPLCTIPSNTTPESLPSGEKLRLSKRSAVNSKLPKWMVSPKVNPMSVRLLPLETMAGFHEGTIKIFKGKHATNSHSWRANRWCFLHGQITWSSRSRDSSFKVVYGKKHTRIYRGSGPLL
jgi:hypothetical protein